MIKFISYALFALAVITPLKKVHAEPSIPTEAQELIQQLIKAEKEFDYTTLAKLYQPEAHIFVERIYPNNKPKRYLEIPAEQVYKIAFDSKSIAENRNDYNQYSNIQFQWYGSAVKVNATRYSNLKNSTTPHVFILKQNDEQEWKIVEEYAVQYVVRQKSPISTDLRINFD